jgi:hypothetical protein
MTRQAFAEWHYVFPSIWDSIHSIPGRDPWMLKSLLSLGFTESQRNVVEVAVSDAWMGGQRPSTDRTSNLVPDGACTPDLPAATPTRSWRARTAVPQNNEISCPFVLPNVIYGYFRHWRQVGRQIDPDERRDHGPDQQPKDLPGGWFEGCHCRPGPCHR